jgi:hypothetical protein
VSAPLNVAPPAAEFTNTPNVFFAAPKFDNPVPTMVNGSAVVCPFKSNTAPDATVVACEVAPNAPVPVPNRTVAPAATLIGPRSVVVLSVPKINAPVPVFVKVTPAVVLMTPNVRSPNPPTDAFVPKVNAPLKLAGFALLFQSAAFKS